MNIKDFFNTPLRVGTKTINKRLVLAPLSKLGNTAFRELLAEFGGYGLLFSEMSSSRAVVQGKSQVQSGFMWRPEELPFLVCQIYGDEPGIMAGAAQRVEAEGFFGVDINFGCSVKSVCKNNCGAALLKNPVLAGEIVSSIRKTVSIPLFVKFRTGWEDNPKIAADMAKRFEGSGADALTFHPRVAPDRRTRTPKWEYIEIVKNAVNIPVFGNGNIFDSHDCEKMLQISGCDGIALGRLAAARPWIFAQWTQDFNPEHDIFEKSALTLVDLLVKHFGEITAMRRFYKFSSYYAANFKFGNTFYSLVHKAKTVDMLKQNIRQFFKNRPETVSRPNITLMR
ncbi:putative tRNA-dihydrouridine synthase [Desulfonema limicola]|uniref:tRNA-dihydrouridine synthase n=1 Tax=Desulfonema limicola TaxID=45656 RepID=A0A975GGW3_9BACT|nr:putative tRNA-dihydrouridine synthase [Desulfonema limicola]